MVELNDGVILFTIRKCLRGFITSEIVYVIVYNCLKRYCIYLNCMSIIYLFLIKSEETIQ